MCPKHFLENQCLLWNDLFCADDHLFHRPEEDVPWVYLNKDIMFLHKINQLQSLGGGLSTFLKLDIFMQAHVCALPTLSFSMVTQVSHPTLVHTWHMDHPTKNVVLQSTLPVLIISTGSV